MVVNVYVSAVTTGNISRHELLAWVNDCLQSNLNKIEEMSTGAAYCQLTDLIFRGQIPLKKVKWNSRNDVDYINNWQILQKAWKEIGIDKPVPVQALMKGKFQDNFEFLQWFKKFFDANYDGSEYNPLEARGFEEFPAPLPTGAAKTTRPAVIRPTTGAARANTSATSRAAPTTRHIAESTPKVQPTRTAVVASKPLRNGTSGTSSSGSNSAELAKLKAENEELQAQLVLFGETVASLEKERDFYFGKLRQIEMLCTDMAENATLTARQITNILYETEDGFVPADEVEEPHPTDEPRPINEQDKAASNETFTLDQPEVPVHNTHHEDVLDHEHEVHPDVAKLNQVHVESQEVHAATHASALEATKAPQQVIDLDDSETF